MLNEGMVFVFLGMESATSLLNFSTDCYDRMNLTYSFECFLIITDLKTERYEKVKTIYPT